MTENVNIGNGTNSYCMQSLCQSFNHAWWRGNNAFSCVKYLVVLSELAALAFHFWLRSATKFWGLYAERLCGRGKGVSFSPHPKLTRRASLRLRRFWGELLSGEFLSMSFFLVLVVEVASPLREPASRFGNALGNGTFLKRSYRYNMPKCMHKCTC